MKLVILAGGLGTRLAEETEVRPKPMVEVGEKPILWHIMKYYSCFGINDFIICLGYKGFVIKEFFKNYFLHSSDVTFDLRTGSQTLHSNDTESWKVTLVNTGDATSTAGRIKRISKYINEGDFCLTYGDGLSNVNIYKTIEFHKLHNKLVTLTAVLPSGRFGALKLENNLVNNFKEKPQGDGLWTNGGFMILKSEIFKNIKDDSVSLESDLLPQLATNGEVIAFKHDDFWQPMDTVRDKNILKDLWDSGKAPWKIW